MNGLAPMTRTWAEGTTGGNVEKGFRQQPSLFPWLSPKQQGSLASKGRLWAQAGWGELFWGCRFSLYPTASPSPTLHPAASVPRVPFSLISIFTQISPVFWSPSPDVLKAPQCSMSKIEIIDFPQVFPHLSKWHAPPQGLCTCNFPYLDSNSSKYPSPPLRLCSDVTFSGTSFLFTLPKMAPCFITPAPFPDTIFLLCTY